MQGGLSIPKTCNPRPILAYVANQDPDTLFLPDFCEMHIVLAVVVIGQLLAFLLMLTPLSEPGERWNDLGMISLFIQWVALTSIGGLCISRRWLRLLDNWLAGVVSYAMVLAITLVLSEVAYRLLAQSLIDVKLYAAMQVSEQAYWFAQRQLGGSDSGISVHMNFLLRNLGISAIVTAIALRYFMFSFSGGPISSRKPRRGFRRCSHGFVLTFCSTA